jgi:iron complex outermembrane receptor protein
MRSPITRSAAALLLAALISAPMGMRAEEPAAAPAEAAATADASADEVLLFYAQEAKVTTASRREQRAIEAPLAVDVITADQIAASGALNLWDLLRYRVGMDVSNARNQYGQRAVVSVRGLPRDFVPEVLVLIDGRPGLDLATSGIYWNRLPVQLQDIERIEIVRGPNSALFGSNAAMGVINIITHKPEGKNSLGLKALGGTRLSQGSLSMESQAGPVDSRGSVTYLHNEGSVKAVTYDKAADMDESYKANWRGRWHSDGLELEGFVGGLRDDSDYALLGPGMNVTTQANFQMVKAAARGAGVNALELNLSRSSALGTAYRSTLFAYEDLAFNGELLGTYGLLSDRLVTTGGLSWRYLSYRNPTWNAGQDEQVNQVFRGFLSENLKVLDSVSLVAAYSQEQSYKGGTQPSWQAAAVWNPLEGQALRVSYGKAPTLPAMMAKHARAFVSAENLMAGAPEVYFVGNAGLSVAKVTSYEAGWSGEFIRRALRLDAGYFYMDMENPYMAGNTSSLRPDLTFGNEYDLFYTNFGRIYMQGFEFQAKGEVSSWLSAYANYTYEQVRFAVEAREIAGNTTGDTLFNAIAGNPPIDMDAKTASAVSGIENSTPYNKVNVGLIGRAFGLTGGLNAAYVSAHWGVQDSLDATRKRLWIQDGLRLDVRLGWKPVESLELFAAGQNVNKGFAQEANDGLETPQSWYGGVGLQF